MSDYALNSTIDTKFSTSVNGTPTALSGGTVSAYPTNSTTQTTTGVTLTADFDGVTGLNHVRVVASGANGYAAGDYQLVITAGTVGGVSVVGRVVGEFSLDSAAVLSRVPASLVSGRIDASVGAMATDTLTAAALATDAVTEIQSGLSTLTAAGVRTAVGLASANLDTQLSALAGYIDTEVSTLLTRIGTPSADVSADIAAIYAKVDTEIASILAAVDTEIAAIKAKTDNLTFTTGTFLDANVQAVNDVTLQGTGIETTDEWRPV